MKIQGKSPTFNGPCFTPPIGQLFSFPECPRLVSTYTGGCINELVRECSDREILRLQTRIAVGFSWIDITVFMLHVATGQTQGDGIS